MNESTVKILTEDKISIRVEVISVLPQSTETLDDDEGL